MIKYREMIQNQKLHEFTSWYDEQTAFIQFPHVMHRMFRFCESKANHMMQRAHHQHTISDVNKLMFLMRKEHPEERKLNVMSSLARYSSNGNVYSYDFFLDIDGNDADMGARAVTGLFDDKHVPYMLRFSGQGYHILIPQDEFEPCPFPDIIKRYENIARFLYENYCELIDIDIYQPQRLIKVPHTLSFYDDDVVTVCQPIERVGDEVPLEKYKDVIGRKIKFHNQGMGAGYLEKLW